jgi:hypothetical protein
MDRQLPVGPLLAGLGALILAISLFLDWWTGLSAFDAYELLDLVLLGLAVATIVSLAGGLGLMRPAISPALSLGIAIVTVVIVVSQIVNDPPIVLGGARDHGVGIWLALLGGVLMTAGALLAYAHISLAVDVRPRSERRDDEPEAAVRDARPGDGATDARDARRPGTAVPDPEADRPGSRRPGAPAVDPDAPTQRP